MLRVVLILLCFGPGVPLVRAQQTPVFDLDGRRPDAAVVTLSEHTPTKTDHGSAMLASLDGVLAVYEGRSLAELRKVRATGRVKNHTPAPEWFVHLERRGERGVVAVGRTPDGLYATAKWEDGAAVSPWVTIDTELFGSVRTDWADERFGDVETELPRGEVVEMPRPYVLGRFVLDRDTHDRRLFAGQRTRVQPTTRVLEDETLYVRLPRGYDGRDAAGLLVWVDPTPSGRPPASLHLACDELGFICVGAKDAQNERPSIDRMQLALDGVATAARQFRVDPERVYVTGMSGGGRISSMLWGAFPDVFRGAVPIVGLNCYERVPTERGHWKAAFRKPRGALMKRLKQNRIAPMSGPPDFNYEQMRAFSRVYLRDGFDLRFFDYPEMGHVMPEPGHFLDALCWVDGVYRESRAAAEARARDLLDGYIAEFGERGARTEEERARLVDVTRVGPWTKPAHRAAELLGYPRR